MSRAAKISDRERTASMLDLLRRKYERDGMSLSHVVVEEVAPGTGWSASQRWADALVLSVWPSNGLTLDGYEIKASRADLKRELSDLAKHRALARYCDSWTLIAWDESVLTDGIPDDWGILLTRDGDDGRELVTHRAAAKQAPQVWPRSFICSLVRNAHQQSPSAAFIARAVQEATRRALSEGARAEKTRMEPTRRELARALYGRDEWKWPREAFDFSAMIRTAVERLEQIPLGGAA